MGEMEERQGEEKKPGETGFKSRRITEQAAVTKQQNQSSCPTHGCVVPILRILFLCGSLPLPYEMALRGGVSESVCIASWIRDPLKLTAKF